MSDIAGSSVTTRTSAQSIPSTQSWFGEAVVIAQYLRLLGVLSEISERVRFARCRFGHYDLIDFTVVLLGSAISSERTLETFYECLHPFWLTRASLLQSTWQAHLRFSPHLVAHRMGLRRPSATEDFNHTSGAVFRLGSI